MQYNTKESYIGLKHSDNSWSWIDGSDLDYDAWDEGQPADDAGDCALVNKEGKWSAENCTHFHRYNCKLKTSKWLIEI